MRRNPPAKWTLPDTTHPLNRKCFMLTVPDDPYYIAAYRGAIWALASAYNWQDDDEHTAKEVALEWRDCIENGDSCMEFRQDECGLYVSINGVETLIYDGQLCINKNIADGTLSKTNSGYLGNPARGSCHTYSAKLDLSVNTWICPNAVNSGDTILMSNWQGGATDLGMLSTFWVCPSGTTYALGACTDIPRSATSYGTDPLQTAPHLAVVAQIGSTYYDVWNSASGITPATFTVPPGIVNAPLRLLMNIGSLVSQVATGEMWGEITVCNYQTCGNFDFMAGQNGWSIANATIFGQPSFVRGEYIAGAGFKSVVIDYLSDPSVSVLTILYPFGNANTLTDIAIKLKCLEQTNTVNFDLYKRVVSGSGTATGYLSLGTHSIPTTDTVHTVSSLSYTDAGDLIIDMYFFYPHGNPARHFVVDAITLGCS